MALVVKNLPVNAGDLRNAVSRPGLGRSPGEGNGSPLQYSHLENPMGYGPRVHKELDTTEATKHMKHTHCCRGEKAFYPKNTWLPTWLSSKECTYQCPGLIPGLGRSPGKRNGNPFQYFYQDRGVWQLQPMGSQKVGHD